MYKGLIFDLDGVIADTARFHLAAWRRLAASLNIQLPQSVLEMFRGRSRSSCLALLLSYANRVYSPSAQARLATQKNVWYHEAIAPLSPADILPGIAPLLAEADARGLHLALASASQNAPAILSRLGLDLRFAARVDPASLAHGKPDPEIFLKAQALLGLEQSEVIGFEDAAAGVQALKAAGQFAVGIGPQAHAADYWVPDTKSLKLDAIVAAYEQWRCAS